MYVTSARQCANDARQDKGISNLVDRQDPGISVDFKPDTVRIRSSVDTALHAEAVTTALNDRGINPEGSFH